MSSQLTLALALIQIWTSVASANMSSVYVFEDDAVFHDDFEALFPVVGVMEVGG